MIRIAVTNLELIDSFSTKDLNKPTIFTPLNTSNHSNVLIASTELINTRDSITSFHYIIE